MVVIQVTGGEGGGKVLGDDGEEEEGNWKDITHRELSEISD